MTAALRLSSLQRSSSLARLSKRNLCTRHLLPSEVYRLRVEKSLIKDDVVQRRALYRLDELHRACTVRAKESYRRYVECSRPSSLQPLVPFGGSDHLLAGDAELSFAGAHEIGAILAPTTSVYMWGPSGCGKTYLLDIFYDSLPIYRKRRAFYRDFMKDVQTRMLMQPGIGKPAIKQIAREIVKQNFVLCLDDFRVAEEQDAAIVKDLFEELFSLGLVLVATSGASIQDQYTEDLYRNGLIHRSRFLPFIALLESKAQVLSFASPTPDIQPIDYRLAKYAQLNENVYLHPADHSTKLSLEREFMRYAPAYSCIPSTMTSLLKCESSLVLLVYGSSVEVKRMHVGRRNAYFCFAELCTSAWDDVAVEEIARKFRVVAIEGIPRLSIERRAELQRFTTLVHSFYTNRTVVLWQAECDVGDLFQPPHEASERDEDVLAYDLAVSQLMEMRSIEYIRECLEARPTEEIPQTQVYSGRDDWERLLRSLPTAALSTTDGVACDPCAEGAPWVLLSFWNMYRLGSKDEVQNAHSHVDGLRTTVALQMRFGVESRQIMQRSVFQVALLDITELRLRDLPLDHPVALKAMSFLTVQLAAENKSSYVDFREFVGTTMNILTLLYGD